MARHYAYISPACRSRSTSGRRTAGGNLFQQCAQFYKLEPPKRRGRGSIPEVNVHTFAMLALYQMQYRRSRSGGLLFIGAYPLYCISAKHICQTGGEPTKDYTRVVQGVQFCGALFIIEHSEKIPGIDIKLHEKCTFFAPFSKIFILNMRQKQAPASRSCRHKAKETARDNLLYTRGIFRGKGGIIGINRGRGVYIPSYICRIYTAGTTMQ